MCRPAAGQSDPNAIASAIYNSLPEIGYDLKGKPWGPTPIWLLYETGDPNTASMCAGLAMFVMAHFQMVGLSGSQVVYCYAKEDAYRLQPGDPNDIALADSTPDSGAVPSPHRSPADAPPHGPNSPHNAYKILGFWPVGEWLFMPDQYGDFNLYEATCLFSGKYFALGEGVYSSAREVVSDIFPNTNWFYVDANMAGGVDPNVVISDPNYWRPCDVRPYPAW